ncbi:porin OmpA [Ursidibacter sp. B-7004-1]
MKKSVIALAVSGLAIASVQAAPQANTFYAGAKAGWASFHDGLTQFDAKKNQGDGFGINRNSVTYGVFGGYQITSNLAVEAGYDYFGRVRGNTTFPGETKDKRAAKHSAHGAHISLKGSYPIVDGLDAYARVGAALVRSDYYVQPTVATKSREKAHNLKTSLVLAGGLEYAITPALAARVEYQWLSRVGNLDKAVRKEGGSSNFQYSPDVGSVSAGLSYRFGQGPAPVVEPEIVTKNFSFSSDVLFAFGKADLKPAAAATLDAAQEEINKLGLASAAIQVNGYTDRIGGEAFNVKLSQRRAESVANYIVSKGVNPANVTAVGYGKANPVTGNTCDAVKGRKALIACLAPDRRVELQVQGSKEVAM